MKKNYAGQALVIVILVMVVALTVGLSVVSRSVTNTRVTTEEENSQRALSAAESGVERALKSGASGYTTINGSFSGVTGNSSVFKTTSDARGSSFYYMNNGAIVPKDEGGDVWLSNYKDYSGPITTTIGLYWGFGSEACSSGTGSETDTNNVAALEVAVLYNSALGPATTHYAFDPCPLLGVNRGNNFQPPGVAANGFNSRWYVAIPVTSGILMRVIPLYAGTKIGVFDGSGQLNNISQGTVVTSTGFVGTSGTSAGDVTRKIIAFRSNPSPPFEFFPNLYLVPQ